MFKVILTDAAPATNAAVSATGVPQVLPTGSVCMLLMRSLFCASGQPLATSVSPAWPVVHISTVFRLCVLGVSVPLALPLSGCVIRMVLGVFSLVLLPCGR
jgi:hypothetical protein